MLTYTNLKDMINKSVFIAGLVFITSFTACAQKQEKEKEVPQKTSSKMGWNKLTKEEESSLRITGQS